MITRRSVVRCLSFLVAAIGTVTAYLAAVRPWGLRWGASDAEVIRSLPGDEVVADPNYETTKAITIDARPASIWPWLAQIGRGRGGLYSFDVLDQLFGFLDAPSAARILPEFQDVEVGDVIPMGHGSWPVRTVERYATLVLGDRVGNGGGWSWAFKLVPLDDGRTRLISRNRARTPTGLIWKLGMLVIDAAALIMTRQMLLNLKRRAEQPST